MVTGNPARILGNLLSLLGSLVGVEVVGHRDSVGCLLLVRLDTVLFGDGGGCHLHDLVYFVGFAQD